MSTTSFSYIQIPFLFKESVIQIQKAATAKLRLENASKVLYIRFDGELFTKEANLPQQVRA